MTSFAVMMDHKLWGIHCASRDYPMYRSEPFINWRNRHHVWRSKIFTSKWEMTGIKPNPYEFIDFFVTGWDLV
jgi:hypothetical protein